MVKVAMSCILAVCSFFHHIWPTEQTARAVLYGRRLAREKFFPSLFADFSIVLCRPREQRRALGRPAYVNVSVFPLLLADFSMLCKPRKHMCFRQAGVRKRRRFFFVFVSQIYSTHTWQMSFKTSVKSVKSKYGFATVILRKAPSHTAHFIARSF